MNFITASMYLSFNQKIILHPWFRMSGSDGESFYTMSPNTTRKWTFFDTFIKIIRSEIEMNFVTVSISNITIALPIPM